MPTKKIALIIPGGIGTGKNNIGVPVLEQIVQLLSTRFEIVVFQLYKANADYQAKGFELQDFKSGNRFSQYFKFLFSFYKSHRKKRFEVIHGFWIWPCGSLAVLLGKILKVKSVVSVLGGDAAAIPEINYGHLRKFFSRTMIRWSVNHADEANALTHYLANNLYAVGLKRKLRIIPWGVDQNLFQFQDNPMKSPIQFLHVANLHRVKDQETLLRAFEIIQRAVPSHLTMIGEGPEKKNVMDLIERLQLQNNVTLQGHLTYQQLSRVYRQHNFLLHTSLAEGQSEVVTEAMSCGVVVGGTNVGLLHDLPDCCISVSPKDYQALASKILLHIHDQDQIKMIQARAKEWTTAHDIHWTVNEYKKLYD